MKTILFQGDSITDTNRDKENLLDLGAGYPLLVAGRLGVDNPGKYIFLNRGWSGNKITELYDRRYADILELKPDYLSILIGVNDVSHEYYYHNGVATLPFEELYTALLKEIQEKLPQTKLILIAPFVGDGEITAGALDWFKKEIKEREQVVRKLAQRFNAEFIALQDVLNSCNAYVENDYWLQDGVHPTLFFHQIIADKWLEAFSNLLD